MPQWSTSVATTARCKVAEWQLDGGESVPDYVQLSYSEGGGHGASVVPGDLEELGKSISR